MCGIMAYKGDGSAILETLIGMEKLEYRGYDSAGISYVQGDRLMLAKQPGCVADLMAKVNIEARSNICIGHTRWATHGAPSRRNAHPHVTQDNRMAIVHNGIIENYVTMKDSLRSKNYKFLSDTDTEVLLYWIYDHFMNDSGSLYDAVKVAMSKVVGAYAFVLIDKNSPHELICGKRGSPLVIGISKDNNYYYVSSDAMSFVNKTNRMVHVEDDTIVKIDQKIETYNIAQNTISNFTISSMHDEWLEVEKGKYKYFMQKEVYEQIDSVKNVLAGRINGYRIAFGGLSKIQKYINNSNYLTLVACGSSYNAALIAKYYIEEFTDKKVSVEYASEFRYRNFNHMSANDIVIGVSQSGETADTIEALKLAKGYGCKIIGVCNVPNSSLSNMTDAGVYIKAGLEIGVASTKAFTNQVLALMLMAMWMGQDRDDWINRIDQYVYILEDLQKMESYIKQVLRVNACVSKIAKKYKKYNKFLFIGRQYNYPVALEGALKMKELCYNYAEGFAAAELKHGPLALVDHQTVAIVLNNDTKQQIKMENTISEIKSRCGKIISIENKDNPNNDNADDRIIVPTVASCLSPIMSVIPLQLFAYHSAILRKKNVDRPRNLAKSVTVE
jgi:glucosamine--fructose-6-phosphate aminotransferase (isomerizing)